MNPKAYAEAWHSLAVGMFYRAQSEANPAVYLHWEHLPLATKLHWQAKAKRALAPTLGLLAALQSACSVVEVQAAAAETYAATRDREANLGLAAELRRNAQAYREAIAKAVSDCA